MNKKMMNIPNAISVLRIILVPVFAAIYLGAKTNADYLFAGAVLAFSGITDMLDGKIARRFNMITDLGKVLDPLADKLTQGTVCVCLAIKHPSLAVILGILIVKEVLIFTGGILIYKKKDYVVSPNIFGKIYTALFFVVMCVVVAFPQTEPILRYVLFGLLICNIYTFIKYVGDFINLNKKPKPDKIG